MNSTVVKMEKFHQKWSKIGLPNALKWPIVTVEDKTIVNEYNWIDIYANFYHEFGFGPIFEFTVDQLDWDKDSVIVSEMN
ncbi:endopeptidase-like protein [Euroglyphus maynei]|uniref:Endopeptidase-like protein n=1 Tax=Euroglyphus maynei TaxID=6958 RepID=A0A1Y3AWT7_EURMA|nr:endopeptidase-like protein [Euroglyphus maynei]